MNNISTTFSSHEVFEQAIKNFQSLLTQLQSDSKQHLEHGEIESQIQEGGIEVLRNLFQGYLDLRTINEKKHPAIIDEMGNIRTHRRIKCSRKLITRFGQVRVHRIGYSGGGQTSVYPMDKALNLPKHQYSHGLYQLVMHEVCQHSFDDSVKAIDRQTGGHIGKRQVELLTIEMSQDFESFYESAIAIDKDQRIADLEQPVAPISTTQPPLLVMTTDAKGIVMHHKDLREETKKAATRQSNKLQTRLSPGEKKNRKRMATVASVYEVGRYRRSARTIMGLEARKTKRPQVHNKRVWASVERPAKAVTKELFIEAKNRLSGTERECLVLLDGDNNQLDRVHAQIKALEVPATIIIDFIHVLEYLWKASYCFYAAGSREAELWVQKKALALLEGKVSQVAAGMRRSATLMELSVEDRKAVDACADYILKRKEYLRYDQYLEKGYPIATGVIEGACRYLIKDRMDITGARWRLKGAEAVLKLRSIRSSGDIEPYFKFYKQQSISRNYGNFTATNGDEFDHEQLVA